MAYTVPRSVGARDSRRTRTELRFAALRTQSALSYERVIWCVDFGVGLMSGLVIIIAPARSESFFLYDILHLTGLQDGYGLGCFGAVLRWGHAGFKAAELWFRTGRLQVLHGVLF